MQNWKNKFIIDDVPVRIRLIGTATFVLRMSQAHTEVINNDDFVAIMSDELISNSAGEILVIGYISYKKLNKDYELSHITKDKTGFMELERCIIRNYEKFDDLYQLGKL